MKKKLKSKINSSIDFALPLLEIKYKNSTKTSISDFYKENEF